MPISIYRATDLYNVPFRPAKDDKPAKPATRGIFGVGKSCFYETIEPHLEKVQLGPKAIGYTDRSVDSFIAKGIAAAAERNHQQNADAVGEVRS